MSNTVKVAKIGKSVYSTNPNDMIFDSDLNTFKIILEGTKTITLTASTTNQSFTQAHGLSFTPLVTAYAKTSGVSRVFPLNFYDVSLWASNIGMGSSGIQFNYLLVDATNITFNFDNTDISDHDVNIRYFCLEDIAV